MTCIPCSRHRTAVVVAVKSKSIPRIATATTEATVALGKNTAAKVMAKFGKRR